MLPEEWNVPVASLMNAEWIVSAITEEELRELANLPPAKPVNVSYVEYFIACHAPKSKRKD